MNAIDLLIGQHRELERHLDALKEAHPARQGDFDKAADELAAHITAEEQIFYPAVNAARTEDILLESLEEHLSLKRVLADLLAIPPDDEKFGPKMHVLAEQASHHHKEEEEHLFPKVKKLLDAAALDRLGTAMSARIEELKHARVRDRIPAQTADSTPLT